MDIVCKWKLINLSELTPYQIPLELTHLDSEASKYTFNLIELVKMKRNKIEIMD